MYLFAPTGFMVMGPITATHVHEGIYASDVIYGEEVVIAVRMPSSQVGAFVLEVDEAVHGYGSQSQRGFGDSAPCNININCSPLGAGWELERDAVGMVLSSSGKFTGSLINNTCNSLTPYFLTAFHTIDLTPMNHIIDPLEESSLSSYVFRFGYEVQSISCTTEPTSWLSYSGAEFRAGWAQTDFILLELNGSLLGQNNVAMAGWDRTNSFPSPTTCIHHPAGDVKKISVDYDNPTATYPPIPNQIAGAPSWLDIVFEDGFAERGSSGGPLFNSSHRIIAQIWGGDPTLTCEDSDIHNLGFPKFFFDSWTGGGTSDTRLSDWLDPTGTGATTLDGVRIPSITTASSLGVTHLLCEDDELTALLDISFGGDVTWEAIPRDMFRYSSGTGTSATVTPSSGIVSGFGSIVFTILLNNGCGSLTISTGFYVGPPGPATYLSFPAPLPPSPVIELFPGQQLHVFIDNTPGASPTDAVWTRSGSLVAQTTTIGIKNTFTAASSPAAGSSGYFYIQTNNTCGPSPLSDGEVWIEYPESFVFEEPSSETNGGGEFIFTVPESYRSQASTWQVLNLQGQLLMQEQITTSRISIPTHSLASGIYLVRFISETYQETRRIRISN